VGKKIPLWIKLGLVGAIIGFTSMPWSKLLDNIFCPTYEVGISNKLMYHYPCISNLFGYGISDNFLAPFIWMIVFSFLGVLIGFCYKKFYKIRGREVEKF
jgi:hypothetical protein